MADNDIDLTKRPIEVAPIAHYHMGGIKVNKQMETSITGLYAAGEAVGGANGSNRLSGNALVEAFVFSGSVSLSCNVTPKICFRYPFLLSEIFSGNSIFKSRIK